MVTEIQKESKLNLEELKIQAIAQWYMDDTENSF